MLSYISNYSSKKGFPANHWNIESSYSLNTILAEGGIDLIHKAPPHFTTHIEINSLIGQEVQL